MKKPLLTLIITSLLFLANCSKPNNSLESYCEKPFRTKIDFITKITEPIEMSFNAESSNDIDFINLSTVTPYAENRKNAVEIEIPIYRTKTDEYGISYYTLNKFIFTYLQKDSTDETYTATLDVTPLEIEINTSSDYVTTPSIYYIDDNNFYLSSVDKTKIFHYTNGKWEQVNIWHYLRNYYPEDIEIPIGFGVSEKYILLYGLPSSPNYPNATCSVDFILDEQTKEVIEVGQWTKPFNG